MTMRIFMQKGVLGGSHLGVVFGLCSKTHTSGSFQPLGPVATLANPTLRSFSTAPRRILKISESLGFFPGPFSFFQFLIIFHTFLKTLGGLIYIGLEFMKFRIEWCQEHPERMEVDLVYKGAKFDFSIIFFSEVLTIVFSEV